MSKSIQNMLQEVLIDSSVTQVSCEQIDLEDLLVYIEAELEGRDAATLHPRVQTALDNSVACRQEYGELKEFLHWEQSGQFASPPRVPHLDFSYLPALTPEAVQPQTTTYQPLWYWEKLGTFVVEFSAELLQSLQSPGPQPTYTFARSNQAAAGGYELTLENTLEDLNIRINIQPVQPPSAHYQLVVETDIPSRGGWPHLADTVVNLKRAEAVVQSRLTDAFGKAVFDSVATTHLAQLKVEIIPGLPEDSDHQSK